MKAVVESLFGLLAFDVVLILGLALAVGLFYLPGYLVLRLCTRTGLWSPRSEAISGVLVSLSVWLIVLLLFLLRT